MAGHLLFQGLTRPPMFAGLPFVHVLLLAVGVMAGFIVTQSLWWLGLSAATGWLALKWLALRDPHLLDIWMLRAREMPPPFGWRPGQAVRYDG